MSTATDILGKIGEKVGGEFSSLRVSLGNLYATQVSLGNIGSQIDFTPYATKTSLGTTNGNVSTNSGAISGLDSSKASKVSINNLVSGASAFTLLSATRADIGDLNVTGTTTTINTQTLNVKDNIIEVNLKSDGSENAQTSGIQVNRGLGSTASHTMTKVMSDATWLISVDPLGALASATTFELHPMSVSNAPSGIFSDKFLWDSISNTIHLFVGEGYSANTIPDTTNIYEWDNESATAEVLILNSGFQFSYTQVGSSNIGLSNFYGSTSFISVAGNNADKATIIWDDNSGQSIWKFGLGSADADIKVKDILVSGSVKVPDANGLKINNISVGDYSTFESAFNTANS